MSDRLDVTNGVAEANIPVAEWEQWRREGWVPVRDDSAETLNADDRDIANEE